MRLAFATVLGFLLGCGSLAATPPACVNGTLSSYLALGATGCTYGGTVFANFTYLGTATGDAPVIRADQITVQPILIVPATAKFTFSGPWAAGGGESQASVIKYTAVLPCGAAAPVELDLALGSAHVQGDIGSVNVRELTNVGALAVFTRCTEVCQDKPSDSLQFKPVSVMLIRRLCKPERRSGGRVLKRVQRRYQPLHSVCVVVFLGRQADFPNTSDSKVIPAYGRNSGSGTAAMEDVPAPMLAPVAPNSWYLRSSVS